MYAVFAMFFPSDPQGRATGECKLALPELMVEIDGVASCPASKLRAP